MRTLFKRINEQNRHTGNISLSPTETLSVLNNEYDHVAIDVNCQWIRFEISGNMLGTLKKGESRHGSKFFLMTYDN